MAQWAFSFDTSVSATNYKNTAAAARILIIIVVYGGEKRLTVCITNKHNTLRRCHSCWLQTISAENVHWHLKSLVIYLWQSFYRSFPFSNFGNFLNKNIWFPRDGALTEVIVREPGLLKNGLVGLSYLLDNNGCFQYMNTWSLWNDLAFFENRCIRPLFERLNAKFKKIFIFFEKSKKSNSSFSIWKLSKHRNLPMEYFNITHLNVFFMFFQFFGRKCDFAPKILI